MILCVAFAASEAPACAGFAAALGQPFDLLLLGGAPEAPTGARTELLVGLDATPPADALADFLSRLAADYSIVAAVSSMASKDVLPRLGGLLEAATVTDAVAAPAPNRFVRPMFAGAVLATVEVSGSPAIVTFRPAGFPAPGSPGTSERRSVPFDGRGATERLSASAARGGRPDLAQAKVVVSGGKPLRDAATFETVIGGLADVLGGAVGATRAAVDSGIAPNELQVGQTGKVVAPDLYIAAGISGSTQHFAGIKDSKLIVAINKDPDAPIFAGADLGLVADLFDAVPELARKLSRAPAV